MTTPSRQVVDADGVALGAAKGILHQIVRTLRGNSVVSLFVVLQLILIVLSLLSPEGFRYLSV